MNIKTLKVGILQTNCYIITVGNSCIIIDPGDESERIVKETEKKKVEKIILTHLHFDHIIAAKGLKNNTGAELYCHKNDMGVLAEDLLNKTDINGFLRDSQKLELNNYGLQIIHTPGHTPGSICLYDEKNKILFSGDTIFKGSVGATHFKGGRLSDLRKSIIKKLLIMPDDIMVYPGHGEKFKLGEYKEDIRNILY